MSKKVSKSKKKIYGRNRRIAIVVVPGKSGECPVLNGHERGSCAGLGVVHGRTRYVNLSLIHIFWLKNRNTEYEIVGYLPVWKIRWFMAPWKKGNAAGVENSRRHVCGSGCGMRCRRMVHLFRFRGQDVYKRQLQYVDC